jgi:hypothetical protein
VCRFSRIAAGTVVPYGSARWAVSDRPGLVAPASFRRERMMRFPFIALFGRL